MAILEDQLLATVKQYVSKGWPHKSKIQPEVQPYYQVHEELELVDDRLYRSVRLVVPKVLHVRVLTLAHTGHPGIV